MRTRRGLAAGAVLLGLFAGGCFFPPEEPGEPEPPLCLDNNDDMPETGIVYTLPNPDSSINFSDKLCAGGDLDHLVAIITSGIEATSSISCDGPMTVDVIVGGETLGSVPCDLGVPFVSGAEPYAAQTRIFRFQADDPTDEVSYTFEAQVTAS